MHCSHCQSLMLEAEISRGAHSEQTWYRCSGCGREQLSSRCLGEGESAAPAAPACPEGPSRIWSEAGRGRHCIAR